MLLVVNVGCAGVLLVIVMPDDVAVVGEAQVAVLVITHEITLPSAKDELE